MRKIGSYFEVVDADEHRIIEELRNLREKKRKDADDIFAADAAKAKSIRIREALIPEVLVDPNIAMIEEFDIAGEDDEAIQKPPRRKQLNRPKNVYGHWVWGMKSHKLPSPSL